MRMIDITDLPLPRDRTAEEREAEAALLNSGNKAPVGIRSQIAALVHEIDFAGDVIFSIETALADMRVRQANRIEKLNRIAALITRDIAPPRPGPHYFGIEYEFGGRHFTTVVSAPSHEIAMREFRRDNPEVNLITIGEHQ